MSPLRVDELVLIDIDERYLDGSDEVMAGESVSVPHLENDVFGLVGHPRAYFKSLVPFRVQTADDFAVDLVPRKLGDDVCVNAAGGKVERDKIFCPVDLDVERVVDEGNLGISDCVLDCGQLSKKGFTGSLMKAESCTIILSSGPKTEMLTKR